MTDQRYCPSWARRFAAILVLGFTRTIVNFSYKFGRLGNRHRFTTKAAMCPGRAMCSRRTAELQWVGAGIV